MLGSNVTLSGTTRSAARRADSESSPSKRRMMAMCFMDSGVSGPFLALDSIHAAGFLRRLHEFDLVAFRGVNEGKATAALAEVRAVGILEAELREMLLKVGEVVHLEGQVREVWLHLHRAAAGKVAKLDEFLAA